MQTFKVSPNFVFSPSALFVRDHITHNLSCINTLCQANSTESVPLGRSHQRTPCTLLVHLPQKKQRTLRRPLALSTADTPGSGACGVSPELLGFPSPGCG